MVRWTQEGRSIPQEPTTRGKRPTLGISRGQVRSAVRLVDVGFQRMPNLEKNVPPGAPMSPDGGPGKAQLPQPTGKPRHLKNLYSRRIPGPSSAQHTQAEDDNLVTPRLELSGKSIEVSLRPATTRVPNVDRNGDPHAVRHCTPSRQDCRQDGPRTGSPSRRRCPGLGTPAKAGELPSLEISEFRLAGVRVAGAGGTIPGQCDGSRRDHRLRANFASLDVTSQTGPGK